MSIVTSLIDARIDLRVGQNVGQSRQYLKIHNKINCLETSSESTLSAIIHFANCDQRAFRPLSNLAPQAGS